MKCGRCGLAYLKLSVDVFVLPFLMRRVAVLLLCAEYFSFVLVCPLFFLTSHFNFLEQVGWKFVKLIDEVKT